MAMYVEIERNSAGTRRSLIRETALPRPPEGMCLIPPELEALAGGLLPFAAPSLEGGEVKAVGDDAEGRAIHEAYLAALPETPPAPDLGRRVSAVETDVEEMSAAIEALLSGDTGEAAI